VEREEAPQRERREQPTVSLKRRLKLHNQRFRELLERLTRMAAVQPLPQCAHLPCESRLKVARLSHHADSGHEQPISGHL
jgi:hypothetical protein